MSGSDVNTHHSSKFPLNVKRQIETSTFPDSDSWTNKIRVKRGEAMALESSWSCFCIATVLNCVAIKIMCRQLLLLWSFRVVFSIQLVYVHCIYRFVGWHRNQSITSNNRKGYENKIEHKRTIVKKAAVAAPTSHKHHDNRKQWPKTALE